MLSVRQLSNAIDSIERLTNVNRKKSGTDLKTFLDFPKFLDSSWKPGKATEVKAKNFSELIPDSNRRPIVDRSVVSVNSIKATLESNAPLYEAQRRDLRFHLIAWHEKFTMAIACIVFILDWSSVGINHQERRHRHSLVFAVVFFVLFFLLNNFGKKFVKEDVLILVWHVAGHLHLIAGGSFPGVQSHARFPIVQ